MSCGQIAYLLLDEALGEYDVETKIGAIEIRASESETSEPRFPLEQLPDRFDQLWSSHGGE